MTLKVGLTGGIGSGKTFVSDCFANLGVNVIDADVIARLVVAPGTDCLKLITDAFGVGILREDGTLNRAKLRGLVFDNPMQRQKLEEITHPQIRSHIVDRLAEAHQTYHMLSSPLLFETDQHTLVDHTIVVDLPEELQIERASARDQQTTSNIRKILAAQMTREERRAKASFIIDNSGPKAATIKQVEDLHRKLVNMTNTEQ